jgi:thiosulfate dehydrogenase
MQSNIENSLGFSTKMMLGLVSVLVVLVFTVLGLVINEKPSNISNSTDSLLVKNYQAPDSNFTHLWEAPADWRLAQLDKNQRDLIHYGKDLIANTVEYLGLMAQSLIFQME